MGTVFSPLEIQHFINRSFVVLAQHKTRKTAHVCGSLPSANLLRQRIEKNPECGNGKIREKKNAIRATFMEKLAGPRKCRVMSREVRPCGKVISFKLQSPPEDWVIRSIALSV